MADVEIVIENLERMLSNYDMLDDIVINKNNEMLMFHRAVAKAALSMLKEQEAVEPKTEPSAKGYWYTCGACGWWLFEVRDTGHFDDRKRIHYCASCGRPVNWNK